jgi:hypothetical protein
MDEIEFKLQVIERLAKIEEHTKNNSATFQKHVEQDEELAADVTKKLTHIELILDRNTNSLELHMRRTSQLENRTEQIEKHVVEVGGAIKFLKAVVWLAGAVGVVYAAVKVFL